MDNVLVCFLVVLGATYLLRLGFTLFRNILSLLAKIVLFLNRYLLRRLLKSFYYRLLVFYMCRIIGN